jgi:Ser/Thr protein kinase RdoA (MazF antagonist)
MNWLLSTEQPSVQKYLRLLVNEIKAIELFINQVQCYDPPLPKQLIHGDLHYDNILCENGQVTGLLDFEFCAFDWRG